MKPEQPDPAIQQATELRLAGQLSEAKDVLERALASADSRGASKLDRAFILGQLAQVHLREGAWTRAEAILDEAVEMLGPKAQQEFISAWATLSERKAFVLFRRGRLDEAAKAAESLAATVGDSDAVTLSVRADIYNTLGGIAWAQHRFDDAIRNTTQAAALYEQAENPAGSANAHANLGVLHYTGGDWPAAMREFEMTEEIRAARGIVGGRATVLYNMGVIAFSRGDYDRARDHFLGSVTLSRRSGESYEPLRVAMALAHIELMEQRIDEACSRLDDVLASPELSNDDRVQAKWLKALVECDRGGIDHGISLASEARQIAKESNLLTSEIDCCLALATAHRFAKNDQECERFLKEAIELAGRAADTYRRALALLDLGELRRDANGADARQYAEEASQLFEKLGAPLHVARARALMSS